jgi:hypothetical protein
METSVRVEINVPEVINLIKRIPCEHLSPSTNDSVTRILRLLYGVYPGRNKETLPLHFVQGQSDNKQRVRNENIMKRGGFDKPKQRR